MIEPIHLEILARVARGETVARVADALFRTQPTITHAIRKLEGELGTRVWRSSGRGIELTPAGRHIARRGESILAELARLEDDLDRIAAGQRGTLRIGVECHPCFQWLTRTVGAFLQRWPEVDIDVVRDSQFSGYDALRSRRIDLVVTPDAQEAADLVTTPVLGYELVLAVAPGHRLAGRTSIAPRDLAEETILTYPVERTRLDIFREFLDPAAIHPARVQPVETIEIMVQLAAAGRGVTAIPDWLVEGSPLVAVPIGAEGIHKQLSISYRTEDAELDYLVDFVGRAPSLRPGDAAEA